MIDAIECVVSISRLVEKGKVFSEMFILLLPGQPNSALKRPKCFSCLPSGGKGRMIKGGRFFVCGP
jgi:hypothetical protein